MIPRELREQILSKLKKRRAWFYLQINRVREELAYTFSEEIAAYVLASENGIDPLPYIKGDEMADYRQAIQMKLTRLKPLDQSSSHAHETKTETKDNTTTPKKIVVQIQDMDEFDVPNLTRSVINDAREMTKVYPVIYLFENSVREFIKEVLDKRSPDWWDNVNKGIKKKVEDRKITETQNAYHGKSRIHSIQYVDFDDLRNIIQSNAKIFNDYMPDNNVEYIQQKLREVKDSRITLMHCNPLTERDVTRVKVYFTDWQSQLKASREKLNKEE